MKAVLVMEMPESCLCCPMGNMNLIDLSKGGMYCQLKKRERIIPWESAKREKPDWCPLVPMPERKEERISGTNLKQVFRYGASCGWNTCLDAVETRNG